MPKRKITDELFDEMIVAFREHGQNFAKVAKTVGVTRATTTKAWREGWPKKDMPPIGDVIRKEALEARKLRSDQEEAELENLKAAPTMSPEFVKAQARRDAIRARAEESKMVKDARSNAIKLLETCRTLSSGLSDLAPRLAVAMTEIDIEAGDIAQLKSIADLIWRVATSSRAITATAGQVVKLERELLGAPIVVAADEEGQKGDEAEYVAELEEAAKSLERLRERRSRGDNILDFPSGKKAAG